MKIKQCTKCGEKKRISKFGKYMRNKDGFDCQCRMCKNSYAATYRLAHPEMGRISSATYYLSHLEKMRTKNTIYCRVHSEELRVREIIRRTDPMYRLKRSIQRFVRKGTGIGTMAHILARTGCNSIEEIAKKLELTADPWFTWEQFGPVYSLDHRTPLSSGNRLDPSYGNRFLHISNLQILTRDQNDIKGDKTNHLLCTMTPHELWERCVRPLPVL